MSFLSIRVVGKFPQNPPLQVAGSLLLVVWWAGLALRLLLRDMLPRESLRS
uniref:Uncharacterized protein n=1 Tax=Anguilla anguilla TaxID=7936 RepID=A0A0E9R713_ANGAN